MILTLLAATTFAQAPDSAALKKIEEKFPPPRPIERDLDDALRTPLRPSTQWGDILASKVIQKALAEKTRIQDIDTEKITVITRPVIVDVHALSDDDGFFYMVDKKGRITHRVVMQRSESIVPETSMYEDPRRYLTVFEKKNITINDQKLQWRPEIALHLGRTSADWSSDILNDTQARHATGYKATARWMAALPGKFQIGGIAQFEGAQYMLRFGEGTYRNYSVGLTLKTKDLDWFDARSRFFTDFMLGPIGVIAVRFNQNREDIFIRTTSAVVGWEQVQKPNYFGDWAWGVSWQRDWPRLRNQTEFVVQDSSSSTNDIVGLHITQGFSW